MSSEAYVSGADSPPPYHPTTAYPCPPDVPDPGKGARVPREHATTKATRLLAAGTYLDRHYRKSVIKELLDDLFRVVAPSYGYDAVSVLAHALAARRMWRAQLGTVVGGAVLLLVLMTAGALSGFFGLLLFACLVWAAAYLRRIATLQTLVTSLKQSRPDGGFDGAYPVTAKLTPQLIRKIDDEQASESGIVFYSGYQPFVGAGAQVHTWSNAELLLGAKVDAFGTGALGTVAAQPKDEQPARKPVIPFGPADIMSYVADRMAADLRDEARDDERIRALTVERRRYATAIRTNDRARGDGWSRLPGRDDLPDIHWREDYDSAREYLCVRIGSWNEELVTSVFVGFDVKGNTLFTEFHTFVLAPLIEDFYLVDQLPDAIDSRLLVRVGWDMTKAVPRRLLRLALAGLLLPVRPALRLLRRRGGAGSVEFGAAGDAPVDTSEFGLGRYVTDAVDCGARTSVREMATSPTFHHYFQQSDTIKYTRIVERRLLQIISTFLHDHNIDLADHNQQQIKVLQQHFGDNNNVSGNGTLNQGDRYNTFGDNSPITKET